MSNYVFCNFVGLNLRLSSCESNIISFSVGGMLRARSYLQTDRTVGSHYGENIVC